MIKIVHENHKSGPVVFCDHCGEQIIKEGNYQWLFNKKGRPKTGKIYFTHKHCYDAFEEKHPGYWGSGELHAFVVFLTGNLRIDWDYANQIADFAANTP